MAPLTKELPRDAPGPFAWKHVFIDEDQNLLTGFRVGGIVKFPGYPLPMLRLARLAVDLKAQGKGVGSQLVRHVFALAVKMTRTSGCVGVLVDAKAKAVGFYQRIGFEAKEALEGQMRAAPDPVLMFLPIDMIKSAFQTDRE